jgi:hypothetical protein
MKRTLSLFVLLLWLGPVAAQQSFDPTRAAVRIKSHGASGTVIATTTGKSWILSCCHMFFGRGDQVDPALLKKALSLDGPQQPDAVSQSVAGARLLAYDARLDLSLIELDNGPFWCIPVAPAGHRPGRLLSAGYDAMRWPVTARPATLLSSQGNTTWTREKPWHGRSGGGLIDLDARVLVGVVQGYEIGGQGRGLYVSHQAILLFLRRHRPDLLGRQVQVPGPRPRLDFPPLACPPSH